MNVFLFQNDNRGDQAMPVTKKFAAILILISFLMLVPVTSSAQTVDGSRNRPSSWAEEEVSDAIEKGLVPAELQSDYQGNIKRYQYVLLALKVFEKTGKNLDIAEARPFTDVLDHEYGQDIIRAYNAGIVKGDGKGNFFPDNYITRQEIASLVVNLLMQIAPGKDFTVKSSYVYNDSNEISDWAKYYIDYCFENRILAGYGNNIIDPKGYATIEQSIALIYRLAKNEGLLLSVDAESGPVKIEELSNERINSFVSEYNDETLSIIKKAAESENVEITSFWDKSATMSVGYNTISLNSPGFEKNIYALIRDINEELFIEIYKALLLNNFSGGSRGVSMFEQNIEKMKAKEIIEIYEEIDDTQVFLIKSVQDNNGNISYLTGYIQKNQ